MKHDPNARNQLDRVDRRKGNRIDEVDALPDRAERGDIVHMEGSTYVYLRGKWVNLCADLLARLEELEKNEGTQGPPGPQGE